jgi:hypothetical protein
MTENRRSRADVENLKAQWAADGTWDIEDTPGFEAYRDELVAYRQEFEAQQERKRIDALRAKAAEIGCPGNLELASHVWGLERQIAYLAERIDREVSRW